MLHLAGHAAFADLEHVGRRSGRIRHTPVRAFRVGDTVVVGLNFGPRSDWFKNVTKAGSSRMRLGKEYLDLGAPLIVPAEIGTQGIPRLFRFGLRYVARTKDCVVLPITMSRPAHKSGPCPLLSYRHRHDSASDTASRRDRRRR
ncbi:nitroreductase family deazaflavin-dependent oxidoreductase [Paractinoplanes durhamensis]